MDRRNFVKAGAALAWMSSTAGSSRADVPAHRWDGYDFGPGPEVPNRLNQGPFSIDQDEGWYTLLTTTPSEKAVRNWRHGKRFAW